MLSLSMGGKCFVLGCFNSAMTWALFLQGGNHPNGGFWAMQGKVHRLDSWMSQSPQASFHRGQHSCGMRPDGDSRVITHLGLHLEGLSKDNRLWTELFFFFNEVGKEREEDGEKL